jgi:hypothetical protein
METLLTEIISLFSEDCGKLPNGGGAVTPSNFNMAQWQG